MQGDSESHVTEFLSLFATKFPIPSLVDSNDEPIAALPRPYLCVSHHSN